jgi:DNA sulfur modification protein DndB
LSAVYQATQALLNKGKGDEVEPGDFDLACEFWTSMGSVIPEWRLIIRKQIAASELRRDYVHSHGVTLHALGIVGRSLLEMYPDKWSNQLQPLEEINWLRTNPLWEGRSMVRGRMSKAGDSVILTANAIKKMLGLSLDADEAEIENKSYAATV